MTNDAIPQLMHFVWLGSPLPADRRRNIEKWKDLHPGWEVRLWSESDLDVVTNRPEFDAAVLYAEKADIVRYEIVYREGGVYIDCDFEPLRNIEPLIDGAQLVVGEQEPAVYANSWFAATAGHPVLRYAIEQLPASVAGNLGSGVDQRTGPLFWTRCVRRASAAEGISVRVLPREVLYPYTYTQDRIPEVSFPGAYAVHHWAKSWIVPDPNHTRLRHWSVAARQVARRAAVRVKAAYATGVTRWRQLEPSAHYPPPTYAVPVAGSRLLINTTARFPLLADSDDLGITPSLVVDGVYDDPFMRFVARELRQGDVAVDVGANIGLFTLQMAHAVRSTGRVIALEPNPKCVSLLRDSLYMNQMRGLTAEVIVHQLAAGTTSEVRLLHANPVHRGMGTLNASAVGDGDTESFSVDVVRLDDLLASVPFVRLIKIDVEGSEYEVLAGMTRIIDEHRVQLIDLELLDVRAGPTWDQLCSILRDLYARPGTTFSVLQSDGSRQPVSFNEAIHSNGLQHLVIELVGPQQHR